MNANKNAIKNKHKNESLEKTVTIIETDAKNFIPGITTTRMPKYRYGQSNEMIYRVEGGYPLGEGQFSLMNRNLKPTKCDITLEHFLIHYTVGSDNNRQSFTGYHRPGCSVPGHLDGNVGSKIYSELLDMAKYYLERFSDNYVAITTPSDSEDVKKAFLELGCKVILASTINSAKTVKEYQCEQIER